MIYKIAAVCTCFIVFILLIGSYLAPNDLQGCGSSPSDVKQTCQKADAIVAISGGDTAARATEAVRLYKNGWASALIFSGAAADKSGPSNAAVMKKLAIEQGVPEQAIITEDMSQTTHENAKRMQRVLESHSYKRIILVTSAYHQRRASIEFKRNIGTSDIKILNSPLQRDNQWSQWWWLTPTGWWLAIGELIKILLTYGGVSQ